MKALIIAGGFATRLRPLSCSRPKILFPIVNKPLLQWTFERLAKNDIREVIMAVNRQIGIQIKQYGVPKGDEHIKYSYDPFKKPLGTGGPIKKAEKLVGSDSTFLALNGDIFADVNYTGLLKAHDAKDAVATIALHKTEDPSRYGVAELTKGNRIRNFVEKPPRESASSNLINAGVYAFNSKIFQYIPIGRAVSLEREVFPKLAEEGTLYGYIYDGLWCDIGEPEDYLEMNKTLLNSTKNQPTRSYAKAEIKKPVVLDKKVSIGNKSVIGPYAVLGRNVIIGNNVHIKNSIIFPETVISDSSSVDGVIIGEDVTIGQNVKISQGCIVGDHAKIKDNVRLTKGVSVCPATEVSKSVLTSKRIC